MGVRKKGKGWEITVEAGKDPFTHKRKQKSSMFYGTERAARQEEKRLKYEQKKKTTVDSSMSMERYLEMWLERTKPSRKYKTHSSYEGECRRHIIPFLGKKRLDKLTPLHIQEYYDYLKHQSDEKRLSNTTIIYHHRILRSALNQACKWKLLNENPVYGAIPPKKKKYEPTLVSDLEAEQILDLLEGDPRRMSVVLTIFTGMRRGETCAVNWTNMNDAANVIQVLYSMGRVKGEGLKIDDTKTGKGRLLPVSPRLKAELIKQKEWQEKNKKAYDNAYNDEGLIVCWEDGRRMDPDQVTKKYNWALDKLGISKKTRLHDLRHSHGTWLLEDGANMKEVQEQLGHDSVVTTGDIYLNPNIESRRRQVDKIDKRFTPLEKKKRKRGKYIIKEKRKKKKKNFKAIR